MHPSAHRAGAHAATPAPAAKALFTCMAPHAPGAPMLAGGVMCKTPDADARAAAAFAVTQLNAKAGVPNTPVTLVSIDKYASQVVAGMNRFLQLSVKDSKGAVSSVQVQVYQPLGNAAPQLIKSTVLPAGSQAGPVAAPVAAPAVKGMSGMVGMGAPAATKP